MKNAIDWEELRLFLAIARAEGLTGAARVTGVSPPTLGRRMSALEQRLGQRLFDRHQTGYALTEAGHGLYDRAQEMEVAASAIEQWRQQSAARTVRISAGAWNTRFLARQMDQIWKADEPVTIELSTAHARVDIVRRQADIGIRNRPPNEAQLVGRKMFDVAYCVYRGRKAARSGEALSWVNVTGDAGITTWARWVNERHGERTALTCSDARTVVDLLVSGTARAVLPCFAGDAEAELERVGDPIPELRGEQWLVLNQAARREPEVRRVIDRVMHLYKEQQRLFTGDG
jgi:DNA-binding transcriptional LysR family regulator